MAQAQVDEWCAEAAKNHYKQTSDTHYAAVPREARGVPHQTIPGLHAYLDDYADAMERARTLIGVEDHRTVDSLQCLPLSPFAERQAPHISEGSGDPAQSNPARLRAQTESCACRVRRPDCAQALPQPGRRRGRRGARLPGGRDVRRRGHHARAARAVRGDHLAAGLHLWPVAALPRLGARRGGGALAPRARGLPGGAPGRRGQRARRARGALSVHAAQGLLRRRASPQGRVALLGGVGGGAAQLDLHVRPRDGRPGHLRAATPRRPPCARRACAASRPRARSRSARRSRTW